MKQFYSTLLFFILTFYISAQNRDGNTVNSADVEIVNEKTDNITGISGLTARPIATSTSPTGNSTEIGVTDGALNISLTGNASYAIPILVPPGINGVEPSISINYNSQRGLSGTAGKGWDISGISSITRIPATKFHDGKIDPVDFNSFDRFALDGQRLVLKSGIYGSDTAEYQTEYFSNIKITSYGVHPNGANYGPAYFTVEYPNGTKAYYGNSSDSRSVMDWSITYVDNPQGVRISYTYTTTNNSLNIDSIKYGGLTNTTPINEIKFIYGPRPTIVEGYVGGIYINRDKNLTNINVSGNGIGFRNYVFDNWNQLISVTEKNGDNSKSYNPTIFEYDDSGNSGNINYVQGNNILDVGNILSTNASTISGDFNADGNMDFILYPTKGDFAKAKYWLFSNTNPTTPFSISIPHSVGSFEEIFPVTYIDASNKLSPSQGWAVAKKTDTQYTFTVYSYSYGAGPTIYTQYSKVVNFPLYLIDETCTSNCVITNQVFRVFPKKIISGDFNGDGLTDILTIDIEASMKSCKENVSTGRCTPGIEVGTSRKVFFVDLKRDNTTNFLFYAGEISSVLTATTKVEVGDFNGDGKSDIFIFDSNYIKIYTLNDSNQLVLLYQNTTVDSDIKVDRPILMGDYNGDGKTDFMVPKAFDSANWYKYTSSGISLVKQEQTSSILFKANDPYNTVNYISIDFNNDNKTDVIRSNSFRNNANTVGVISIQYLTNNNGSFLASSGIREVNTGDQADINIYALPVYLPTNQQTLKNGTSSSTLQIAFLNQNKIHFFSSPIDFVKGNLLTNIRNGNGVEEAVTYIPLNLNYRNNFYNIYTPSTSIASYPYADIQINPSLYIVSKIEQRSKDVYKKRWFGYYGAVSNLEGLGFMGFRSVTQTNWHDDNSKVFTDIYKNDIDLRGANVEITSAPYLSYPYPEALPPDFTTKSITTYNNLLENPLQSNKVFKLKTTNVKESNTLNNTNTEVKDIVYDTANNIMSSTTVSSEGSAPVKTEKTDISYQTPKTTPFYILGRPESKIQSVTADGHTMTINETYSYNSQELLSSTEKSAIGTSTVKESNEYDSYGNIIKKTVTPNLPMLPRSSVYEYDPTKRFVSKITDNNNLVTSFEYDSNGLLKKVIDPYARSKSYNYDSWFKKITTTDDQLGNIITNIYSRSTEKTIVTTTVLAPSLDTSVTENTFDDLGRRIKSGVKDVNGNFSYESYLYDIYNRNIKISESYFGTSPSQWNEVKFDDYGRNTQSILFSGRTISTSYPTSSLNTIVIDGPKTKTSTQNAVGNTISTDETIGGSISYNYFANGNLRKTSYNGVNINIEQDGWGQKTKLIDPSAGTFNYNYNDLGELISETIDGTGITTTITRDSNGKPTQKIIVGSGTDSVTNYTYDGDLPLTIDYTDNNEPSAINRTLTRFTYDSNYKRISSIVEEKFNVSKFTRSFTYDALDRILTETKEAVIGNLISSSVTTTNVYKNGTLYQIKDSSGKVLWQVNTLNAKGQVLQSVLGNGISMNCSYEASNGYLSKIQYDKADSSNVITLTTEFDFNTGNLGKRINSAFGNYTEVFEYDDISRLTKFTNKLGLLETQTYDFSGKINGNNLGAYSYDSSKPYQNTSITLTPEAMGYYSNREGIYSDSMEDKNGWGASRYPNSDFISYDETKVPHAFGKNTLKLVNTTTTEQYVFADKWISIDNAVPTDYTYSAWVYSDSSESQMFLFMKDSNGNETADNVLENTTGAWKQITKTFSVPANVKEIRLRLDNNGFGNMWYDDVEIRKTSDPSSVMRNLNVTYNAFKSPIEIEETNVDKISFTYNDENQRSTMYYGGFQTVKSQRPLRKYYSADGTMEVKENTITNTFEFVTFIGGDGYTAPIILKSDGINPSNYLYLHRDYQGTILAITDDNGTLLEKRLFDAWGSIIKVQNGAGDYLAGLTVLDRGYTGHEHLQSIGLINMNARLYDPILHRFLQADNYIQDLTNTQNYNQYGYVLNNPLLYTDPSGNIGEGGGIGIGPGTQTGSSVDLEQLGKDTGITQWAKKNLNFNSWGRSWNRLWGKNGSDDNTAPQANVSKYGNIQMPTQHSSFGFNWTYLSQGKPGERFTYDFFNGFYTTSQFFIGRGVGDYSMRNLDSSATTTNEAVWGLVGAVSNGTALVELKGLLSTLKTTVSVATGKFYSVAFEAKISNELFPTKGVSTHFRAANNALAEAMASDVPFASSMEQLKIIVPRTKTGIVSPGKIPNWVWHHSTEPGTMQLVPQVQHTNGSIFWNTLHPGGRGGMSIWGGGYRR